MLALHYADSSISRIPHKFILENGFGAERAEFFIAKSSYIGPNSVCRFDNQDCKLNIGRYVSGAFGITFLPDGVHPVTTISSYIFEQFDGFPGSATHRKDHNRVIDVENDVWIGDQCFILGGATISNGCVLGARTLVPHNKQLEPYGIYVGSPARLIRFRFPEKVRELLVELAWWEMPLSWIRQNLSFFKLDLTLDEGHSIEICKELLKQKTIHLSANVGSSALESPKSEAVEISQLKVAEDELEILRINSILHPLILSAPRAIVYPADARSNWLMANTILSRINIIAFGDRNANKHGKYLFGVKVIPPSEIQKLEPDIVFITSELHGDEILGELSHIVDSSKVKLIALF